VNALHHKIYKYIQVKNTLGVSSVVFCACEVTQLFSVLLCVVRAVHEFGSQACK
jgi:hypothetical protein